MLSPLGWMFVMLWILLQIFCSCIMVGLGWLDSSGSTAGGYVPLLLVVII